MFTHFKMYVLSWDLLPPGYSEIQKFKTTWKVFEETFCAKPFILYLQIYKIVMFLLLYIG